MANISDINQLGSTVRNIRYNLDEDGRMVMTIIADVSLEIKCHLDEIGTTTLLRILDIGDKNNGHLEPARVS